MTYPEHIYDPLRRQLAAELLEKEYAKLFPVIPAAQLRGCIQGWSNDPARYHLEDATRDFWDCFAALMESVKLKPGFSHIFTAKNYTWERASFDPMIIEFTSPLAQLHKLLLLDRHKRFTAGDVMHAIQNDDQLDEQRRLNDAYSSNAQDAYRIIVRSTKNGTLRVMDGNRRLLRAALYHRSTIDAWVGRTSGDEQPRDFWMPTGELYQLVRYYQTAATDAEKQVVRNMLEVMFRATPLARVTYRTRIENESDATAALFAMKPTI